MFNNVKYECFSQYVILNNARVSALADRVAALEEIAAEYVAEQQDPARVPEWDIPETYSREQLEAAEYNAYEAGYRDASGGKPSPQHLAAISKPIKKAEPEETNHSEKFYNGFIERGYTPESVEIFKKSCDATDLVMPAPKAEKGLINHYIDKLQSLNASTMGNNDPDKLKIQFAIQHAIDELKAEIA
ncbi:hypothetical protein XY27_000817 [Salmonella enterica subsp. enterica]|nr:hypothetical protein [Salmonella enterica subsp. enterica serovar Kisangani]